MTENEKKETKFPDNTKFWKGTGTHGPALPPRPGEDHRMGLKTTCSAILRNSEF